MHFAYEPELWQGLFEMVALAAVTLTGLLSVALSINVRHIVDTPSHLARCLVWSTNNAWSLTIAAAEKHRVTL